MNEIKNVLICGLGAIGGYYAAKLADNNLCTLKVLTDINRYSKYISNPRIINGKKYIFDYVLPDNADFKADLIIISTKYSGLSESIKNIANFVENNTIILSFLNGVTSEKDISKTYGYDKVLYSFLLGHTFFRKGNTINHDGNAKIYFGSDRGDIYKVNKVKDFFDKNNILYEVPDNIVKAQWEKFCFNCCVNQVSGVTRMTFGEMEQSDKCLKLFQNICEEISMVAEAEGVDGSNFYNNTIKSLKLMMPEGKTSMLQDIEAGNRTEIEIFGETVVKIAEKNNLTTPYNKVLSDLINVVSSTGILSE